MRTSYIIKLRQRLRACIHERDAYGLTDTLAAELNDLECRIAWAERAYPVVVREPWWRRVIGWVVPRGDGAAWEKVGRAAL